MNINNFYRNEIAPTDFVMCKTSLVIRDHPHLHHWHDYVEILHILNSDICLQCENTAIDMSVGDTALIMPGVIHCTYKKSPSNGKLIVTQALTSPKEGQSEFLHLFTESLRHDSSPAYLIRSDCASAAAVGQLCKMILSEVDDDNPGKSQLIEGGIMQLMGYFMRETGFMPQTISESKNGFDIYRICEYIDRNMNTVTLNDAAEFAGYSPNYFSVLFREMLGSGFRQYVDFVRTRRAERMMVTGTTNISSIAESLGYDSVQNFSRSFKRVAGYTPTEFLRNMQTNEITPFPWQKVPSKKTPLPKE